MSFNYMGFLFCFVFNNSPCPIFATHILGCGAIYLLVTAQPARNN